jgi:hypothetical protein
MNDGSQASAPVVTRHFIGRSFVMRISQIVGTKFYGRLGIDEVVNGIYD